MNLKSRPVAVLAATGTVGQKIIHMLEDHPFFHVAEVAASENSVGKTYLEATAWRELAPMPDSVSKMKIKNLNEVTSPFVLSALPADVAKEIEPLLASRGQHVVSNASAMRMDKTVPLIIPEINLSHLELLDSQTTPGKIITNPNCSTVFMCLALAPLKEISAIKHISVTTLQALSGAGHPGVPSFDLLGNTIPNIGGEEDKMKSECLKILGSSHSPEQFSVSVQVNRVPVVHGHSISMHIEFENNVSPEQVFSAYQGWNESYPNLFVLYQDEFSPQPARHITSTDMRTHIGRIKQGGSPNRISLVSMGHNLVRGAAGAAISNLASSLPKLEEN